MRPVHPLNSEYAGKQYLAYLLSHPQDFEALQSFVQSQLELTMEPTIVSKAEPDELDALGEPVDEELDRTN
jgi:hypothetical protein